MNILVVQLAKLGDIFQSSYSIDKIRRLFPQSKIYFLCSSIFKEAGKFLDADKILSLNLDKIAQKSEDKISFLDNDEAQKALEKINNIGFDIAINLNISELAQNLFSRITSNKKFGYYSNHQESLEWLYFVLSFIKTRKLASINLVDVYRHSFFISKSQKIVHKSIQSKEKIICFSLGTRNLKRNWDVENFVKLAELFSQSNYKIYLIGSKSESENGRFFLESYDGKSPIYNVIGKTNISELVELISKSSLLVSGDTGSMHIASYYSTPTIAIFSGPAYPYETAGYFAENKITTFNNNLDCYPCNEETVCLNNFVCNKNLTPQYIYDIYKNNADFYKPIYDEIGQFLIKKENNSEDFIMTMFYRDFALKYFFQSALDFENLKPNFTEKSYEKAVKLMRREFKVYSLSNSESSDSYFLKPYFYLKKLLPNHQITKDLFEYLQSI